ncbi:lipopolysaccharide modification acyltransferase [Segatella salivae]|uniref:lipopolysaccharide modification acyltransferase n=1 Tax=Segatella salivae TaxID=228604 RepID=UPI0028DC3D2F|nr:lipopolysaccharide modification acyltransferase [Segatella salivae]
MNVFYNIHALMVQRCKRCTFDSPGLTSESEVYPGLFAVNGNNAVGVVPFIP